MIGHCVRIFALAGAFVAASMSAASFAAAVSFNGPWTLVAQTTDGHCGYSTFEITISSGRVYYAGGILMGFPASLTGAVASSGRTRLALTAGPRTASGTGQLGRSQGSGTWAGQGPSGTCSGVWTAARAQANAVSGDATQAVQMPVPFWMAPVQPPPATPSR